MSAQPLVSVVMPVYNHERYVQDAIRSVMNQTYQNIQLIVIDDGSKDSSWQKVQEMRAECEKRFMYFYATTKENEGIAVTFNKMLEQVRGDYCYLLASDDLVVPHAIERLVKELQSGDCILAVGNKCFVDAEGNRVGCDENFSPVPLSEAKYKTFCDFYIDITGEDLYHSDNFGSYKTLLVRNYIPNGSLYKSSAVKRLYFTKEAPLEDWFLHLQLSKMGKYKFIDDILFLYRLHGNNAIGNKKRLMEISQKTLDYERRLYENSQQFMDVFQRVFIDKYYLNLGFLKVYKKKYLTEKDYCLSIFHKEFIFHKKFTKLKSS